MELYKKVSNWIKKLSKLLRKRPIKILLSIKQTIIWVNKYKRNNNNTKNKIKKRNQTQRK